MSETIEIRCPKCNSSGPFRYVEDIESYREVEKIEDGLLIVDGFYRTGEGYDDGKNARLECQADHSEVNEGHRTCFQQFAIPEGLEIDFV